MGRIRSALHAYTLSNTAPARVLDLVDRKVISSRSGLLRRSHALCSSPLRSNDHRSGRASTTRCRGAGTAGLVSRGQASPPIGTHLAHQRSSTTITLAPDAVIAFYTDGLIERRGESLDVGLERLREAISPGAPDRVAHEIMRHLIAGSLPADDIALVVVRRARGPSEAEIQSKNDNEPVVFAVPYDSDRPGSSTPLRPTVRIGLHT